MKKLYFLLGSVIIGLALNAYLMADLYNDLTSRIDRTNDNTSILIDQYNNIPICQSK